MTINLLSLEKRRESIFRGIFFSTKAFLELSLFVVICIAIVTIGAKLFLLQTTLTFSTAPAVNIRTRELELAVRKTNQTTAILERLDGETTQWSSILLPLTNAIPPAITLTEITLNKKTTPNLVLKGRAATRNDLLVLKTAIEKLPFITNLSLPLTNLLTPKDIDWQLQANIITNTP